MKSIDCGTAEILAGAIALGEAGDAERDGYRRHLSTCERCVRACGGEREIERVMATIARAREQESWEPDLRAALRDRSRMRRGAWIGGIGAGVAAALAASVGIHALLLTTAHPISL
ncbi:MAG TPA: hypothetical protein VMH02_00155, partial [Verrucomicrobiae bacterium]|nr:hypothetical protein [Verrucomicrobiae bacterium]